MKLRTLGLTVLGIAGSIALPSCKKDEAPPVAAQGPALQAPARAEAKTPEAADTAPQPAVTGGGVVRGTVTFAGELPVAAPVMASSDPACQGMALTDQAVQVEEGRLANVVVRIREEVSGTPSRPVPPVTIDQRQCTYSPRVQGAVAGQEILIKNSDGTLHNARGLAGTKVLFNVAQPPEGKPVARALPTDTGVIRFKCDIHPWMVAWVVTSPHPYFATTGAEGTFLIEGVPPGSYTLEAWHESLGARTAQVTVKEGEETAASFEFSAAGGAGAGSRAADAK